MPTVKQLPLKDISLDLKNFRTTPQPDEKAAIKAMLLIDPTDFRGLMESILVGYRELENLPVLKGVDGRLVVKEGNRRVAVLKLIHGLIAPDQVDLPSDLQTMIKAKTAKWRKVTEKVSCLLHDSTEEAEIKNIVSIAHGKGEKASKSKWTSVATARHNRDENNAAELGLDLLESYLKRKPNINLDQQERWGGNYPITVLNEVLPNLAKKSGLTKAAELVSQYPNVKHKDALENLLRAIGLKQFGFDEAREKREATDYSIYGYPTEIHTNPEESPTAETPQSENNGSDGNATSPKDSKENEKADENKSPTSETKNDGTEDSNGTGGQNDTANGNSGSGTTGTIPTKNNRSLATTNPQSVKQKFAGFTVRGPNREKIVDLVIEAIQLDVKRTPLAFCFILRSMFDLSASIFSKENSIDRKKMKGKIDPTLVDKTLAELLKDIYSHLIKGETDKVLEKELFGAQQELRNSNGILSVTSMNQLIHNPNFTIDTPTVCRLFHNIFPLLRAMNS